MAQDTRIDPAPDVEKIAAQLIRQYHSELLECTLGYYFTTAATSCKPLKCNPVIRYGYSTHLGAPRAAVDEGPEYLLLVTYDEWDVLVPGQQEPFIDHRLQHIFREATADGGIRWRIRPHPLEEFPETVDRFGLWTPELKAMQQTMEQFRLPLDELVMTSQERTDGTAHQGH